MNASFKKIAEELENAGSVYIYPHENPDGDAIGSCAALAAMLRGMGKKAIVIIDEEIPDNLRFMDREVDGSSMFFVYKGEDLDAPDISMAVDCNTPDRFPKRKELFDKGNKSICVDHHVKGETYFDIEHIDPMAAASGELIYDLMLAMGHTPDKEEAEALFAAITTDTGDFQYSNTTKRSHEIVCALYDSGIDVTKVSVNIYQCVAKEKLALEALAMERVRFAAGGKIAYTEVTQDMLSETGALMSDAEPVVAKVRTIKGAEMAFVFKEKAEGGIFVSMRAKTDASVRDVAVAFGGGGHEKAAGATLHDVTIEEAEEKVIAEAEKQFK